MQPPETQAPAPEDDAGATQERAAVASEPNAPDRPGAIQSRARLEVVSDGAASKPPTTLLWLPITGAWLRQEKLTDAGINSARRVEMVDGYPRPTGWARFRADAVQVGGAVTAPAPELVRQMLAEISAAGFPKMVTLTAIGEPPPGVNLNDNNVFVCHDFEGRVAMVHQRYDVEGGKGFLPWTKWDDGQWRKIEPEVLPFYGLPGANEHGTLILHEGSKAAARVKRLLSGEEEPNRAPWLEEMRWAAHVGWVGGVHAVDRSDWRSLAAMGWKRVIIIADNDVKGMRAAPEIAVHFPANVFILAFDQRFKDGFDCGDLWPAELFDEDGFYTGPSMEECLRPATMATRLLPPQGPGRPPSVIRREFAETVAYSISPPRFMLRHRPSRDMSAEEFNALVAPFSHARKETASKLLDELECQHDRIIYHPAHAPGSLTVGDQRCFNVFEPSRVRPIEGDATLWEEYLAHLIPEEDERALVKRWLATLIAVRSVRMRYGLLLISVTHGVGKNTLAKVLQRLLGPANVSFPSEHSVVESQFNGWLTRKLLIFIAEIYSGHSRKANDKLKAVLADDDIEVNQKGIDQYRLDNWATVIACSNSEAALYLDGEDRRWFVPAVAETLMPGAWWKRFYAWIAGQGPGIILQWAHQYVADHGHVQTGDHAPSSKRKMAIAQASRSEGQQLAAQFAENLIAHPAKAIVSIRDVRKWIALQRGFRRAGGEADIGDRRLERPATITSVLKKIEGVCVWADDLRPKLHGTREAVVMNFTPEHGARWADIKEHLTDLEGVKLDDPM